MDSAENSLRLSDVELKWNEVIRALTNLSLTWVTIGDYVVVMNGKVDATIGGEPYLALQLWLNLKSGRFIKRVWDQTVASGKVISIAHFNEACSTLFKGRPCIGYPETKEKDILQDFIISQTPIPRKISGSCLKVLDPGTDTAVKSCPECLKLSNSALTDITDPGTFVKEKSIEDGGPKVKQYKRKIKAESFPFEQTIQDDDHDNPPVLQSIDASERELCSELEDKPSCNVDTAITEISNPETFVAEKIFEDVGPKVKQYKRKIKAGNYVCGNADCSYKTKYHSNLVAHFLQTSHSTESFTFEQSLQDDDHVNPSALQSMHVSEELEERPTCNVDTLNRDCEDGGKDAYIKKLVPHSSEKNKLGKGYKDSPMYMKCEICGRKMLCVKYAIHMREKHGQLGKFFIQCVWCGEKFTTAYFGQHALRIHFYGRFTCGICTFHGNFAKDLIEHMNGNHEEKQLAECPSCKNPISLQELDSHYKGCIKNKIKEQSGGSNDEMCATCGKTFKRRHLARHLQAHLREEAEKRGESVHEWYHHCDKCDKKFTGRAQLAHHIKSVHENFRYPCSLCSKTFASYHSVTAHKIKAHSTDKKYECRYCGKRLVSAGMVKQHELVHEDPKFACRFCQKKLKTLQNLEAHERGHTGEKPFKCPICGDGFVAKFSLLQHTKGVHKIAGPKGGKTGWNNTRK